MADLGGNKMDAFKNLIKAMDCKLKLQNYSNDYSYKYNWYRKWVVIPLMEYVWIE